MLIPFNQLFARHKIHAREVLHVGANTGQEAEAYARMGMERVTWVESHEQTYKKLVAHVGSLAGVPVQSTLGSFAIVAGDKGPIHYCLNACISNEDGKVVTFNVANNGCQSSSILEFGTHTREHPTVEFVEKVQMKTQRLDTLLAERGIEFNPGAFLNIDLQGAELLALQGLGAALSKFDHLYLEVNTAELYKGCPLVGELDVWLKERGFVGRETKMTGSGWGDKYYGRIK